MIIKGLIFEDQVKTISSQRAYSAAEDELWLKMRHKVLQAVSVKVQGHCIAKATLQLQVSEKSENVALMRAYLA